MNIAITGLSYKTAPVEIREKLSIPEAQAKTKIARLLSFPHIEEAAVLSTCNRLEIYTAVQKLELAEQEVTQFLSEHSQLPSEVLTPHLFTLNQRDAAQHLMWVASGLDSLVIGEGQILAQVKQAYKLGQQHQGIQTKLSQLFKQAITAGKRVRSETAIGTGAVSVSSAAVELADLKVPNLCDRRVVVVGAGKMAKRLVQHLLAKGVTQLAIVNRSLERAQDLANQFMAIAIQCYPLADLMSVVANAELVFTSTASMVPLLNRAKLDSILSPHQPMLLFDISVPRNVATDVNELNQVHVFNVDDLKAVVAQNQENRQQLATEAQVLINEELDALQTWWRSRETVPTICCLRQKIETIREQELEKALSRLGSEFTQKHQDTVEALSRGIVNKILHEPMVQLRTQRDIEDRHLALQTLQKLFALNSCVVSFPAVPKK